VQRDVAVCFGGAWLRLGMLGLTDSDVRLGGDPAGTIRADRVTMRSVEWLDKPFLQRSAFELFAGGSTALPDRTPERKS
jgi:hypothetical protein